MIDEATIARAAELLQQAAPGARIILFGSYARGDQDEESDLDFLVIEPNVTEQREEMVRLRDVVRPLRIPVDIVVTSRRTYEAWSGRPGTLLYEAAREGKEIGTAG